MNRALLGISLLLAATTAMADSEIKSLENLSEELVKIRHQIETLHNEINQEKESYRDKMRSYSSQKSDLEVRISRSELNIKDLQRELKKIADSSREKNKAAEDITPVLKKAIAELRTSVSASLPFKLPQRLAALTEIEHRLDTFIITPNKAANQLWAFVEDELMLGKSSGIYNDTINIDGHDKLVKVLRLGKIAMFYKTSDSDFGMIKQDQGTWKQEQVVDSSHAAQLEALFDSFSKNIRNGQFTTPNFLPRS